jgi:cytochrome P450
MNAAHPVVKARGRLPLLGHALPLLRDPLAFLTSLPAQGAVVQIGVGPAQAVVVCDPELTRAVLVDDRTYDRGGILYDRARDVLGNGLITCVHSSHRRLRRLVQPAFHPARLPGYARLMAEQVSSVTSAWQDGQVIDVLTETTVLSTRIAVMTMFAGALSVSEVDQVAADFITIVKGVYHRMFRPGLLERLPATGSRDYHEARDRLRRVIASVAAGYRASAAAPADVLSILMAAGDSPDAAGPKLTDDEIHDNILAFFIAGAETSAILLSWALHLLGLHPDIDQRHHAQIESVLAGGRPVDIGVVPELTLTGQIITETLRLYPPGWMFTRATSADCSLGGYPIPAGRTVIYSPYLIHRRPDLFPEPDRFDPDRWSDAAPPRNIFIPFGGGARKCIGESFALTEATLALASVTARWRLQAAPGSVVRPAISSLLSPRGLLMTAWRR